MVAMEVALPQAGLYSPAWDKAFMKSFFDICSAPDIIVVYNKNNVILLNIRLEKSHIYPEY